MKKLLFIILFAIGVSPLIMAQSTQDSYGQEIPIIIKKDEKPDKTLRAPIILNIKVAYHKDDNSISMWTDDTNAEVYLFHNGNEIDYSSSIPAVFYLPFNDGCYTITIVGGSWTAEGCLEL